MIFCLIWYSILCIKKFIFYILNIRKIYLFEMIRKSSIIDNIHICDLIDTDFLNAEITDYKTFIHSFVRNNSFSNSGFTNLLQETES